MPKHAARRARRWPFAVVLVVLFVASAVAAFLLLRRDPDRAEGLDAQAPPATGAATTTAPPATLPVTTATTAPPPDPVLGSGQPVTIAFAGDTNFEGSNATRLARDPASVLAPIAGVLSGADLTVVNMETALGVGGTPAPKDFTFLAPPEALEAFRAAGVDVVSEANNHGLDFGPDVLEQSVQASIDHDFPVIGIGLDEDHAFAPYRTTINGQRIAVIAATQVLDGSLQTAWTATATHAGLASAKRVDRLVQEVAAARATSDTVVVFLHWGIEQTTCPSGDQEELAQQLIDAGADVVVGSHAHRVLGGGMHGDAVVDYGLGNFAFKANSAEGARSGVFTVTITGRHVDGYEWTPARIVDSQPIPLTGDEADAALDQWNALRNCTDLTP